MAINKLIVADQAVLISREIEQAPIKTVIRELVQNAIEAREQYEGQERKIEFYLTSLKLDDGTKIKKLSIKNNGIGMSGETLKEVTNLSSSAHKTLGKGRNYGIGAKVSGLRTNPAGLRYRSCHNGIVSEVTLVEEDGVYGRWKDEEANEDAFDVTDEYNNDLFATNEDWTEVTLYGREITDNTLEKPFGDELIVEQNWLNVLVHYRYFKLPNSVSITYDEGLLSKTQTRRTLKTWQQILNKQQIKFETVDTGKGIKVTYALNSAKGWNVHQIGLNACGAIVYKGEMFDVATSNKIINKRWGITAPKLGIPFGSDAISVFIELDESLEVDMNMYRDKLVDNLGNDIFIEDFATYVFDLMPEWIKEHIDKERNKHKGSNSKLKERIAEIIRNLNIQKQQLKPSSDGIELIDITQGDFEVNSNQGQNLSTNKKKLSIARPGKSKPARNLNGFENIPEWSFITETSKLKEYDLLNFAASYTSGVANQIYINGIHHNFLEKQKQLEEEFSLEMNDEKGRELIEAVFQEEYAFNLVLAVIHAKYEWKKNKWDDEDLSHATSRSALTTSISKDYTIIAAVKQKLKNNNELKFIRAAG